MSIHKKESDEENQSPNKKKIRIIFPTFLVSGFLTATFYNVIVPKYIPSLMPKVCTAEYKINGKWFIMDSIGKQIGDAQINQIGCSCDFSITGEYTQAINNVKNVNFHSIISKIKENEIFFMYENNEGEKGVCQGDFKDLSKQPTKIYLRYYDLTSFDKNKNPYGILVLNKKNED